MVFESTIGLSDASSTLAQISPHFVHTRRCGGSCGCKTRRARRREGRSDISAPPRYELSRRSIDLPSWGGCVPPRSRSFFLGGRVFCVNFLAVGKQDPPAPP